MKWSNTIQLSAPLRDVRLLSAAPPQAWPDLLREREAAGYARGRREGESALGEQLIQQRAEMAELQKGILDSLRQAIPRILHDTEGALIQLALESAQKVVAGLPISVELMEGVVREALRRTEETSEITIQLHPDDLALLQKHGSELLHGSDSAALLRFTPSAEVSRGGCIVQTRFGLIDARREVKLKQLAKALDS